MTHELDNREDFYKWICECAEALKHARINGSALQKARVLLSDLSLECLDHLNDGMKVSKTLEMLDDLQSFAEVGDEIDFDVLLMTVADQFKEEVSLEIK